MAKKRKDSRGIVLQSGESQNTSGRYRYRYFDNNGVPHDVYSWKLRPEDKAPEGKKCALSLREMEKQIQKDLDDNLMAWKGSMNVNKLVEEYLQGQAQYLAVGTVNAYEYCFQKHIKQSIGAKKVSRLTSDDIEKFYSGLLNDKKSPLKIKTICTIDNVLRPALNLAVKKNIIRNNPANGILGDIKKKCPDRAKPKKRHALEADQQSRLLEFIKDDAIYSQYYAIFYLLAWTGCRINELLALTWQDIDFQKEIIYIRRSLSYKKVDGSFRFILKEPKTKQGIREIPMLKDVKKILIEWRELTGGCKVILLEKDKDTVSLDDLSAFVFRNSNGKLHDYSPFDDRLKRIVTKYNSTHEDVDRLPDISCHTFRHSFCCWLCENTNGTNSADDIKYIQSVMGHADISTTLNIYSELRKGNQENKHTALKKKAKES